jgi:hypothetical protein
MKSPSGVICTNVFYITGFKETVRKGSEGAHEARAMRDRMLSVLDGLRRCEQFFPQPPLLSPVGHYGNGL